MKTILVTTLACAACQAQSVTIVNSGSTNTAGFQIVVEQSGHAEYTSRPRRRGTEKTETPQTISKTLPKSLADSLYADVEAARPLSSLPAQHCIKSASFGTRLFVQLGEDRSPDLSCGDGGNEKMRALIRDAEAVIKIFRGE
jgi:hypothetical protein